MNNLNVSDKMSVVEIEVGSEVWCSAVSHEDALEHPHSLYIVIGKGKEQYHTIGVEDVFDYNSGNQVTIFPWEFAVPTGRKAPVVERAFLQIPCQQLEDLWGETEERDFAMVAEHSTYRIYITDMSDILYIFREINDYY